MTQIPNRIFVSHMLCQLSSCHWKRSCGWTMGHGGTESEYLGRQAQEPTVSAVVLMHTKILELLSYRASEEH